MVLRMKIPISPGTATGEEAGSEQRRGREKKKVKGEKQKR